MNLVLLSVVLGSGDSIEWRYIQEARYRAGSMVDDPKAPGGYFRGRRLPKVVSNSNRLNSGFQATLYNTTGNLTIYVTNGGHDFIWLPARDSLLKANLEAKDRSGKWRPIEYHSSTTCGNSNHRVILPPGYEWTFKKNLPEGNFQTKVRLRLRTDGGQSFSNEVRAFIYEDRFIQSASLKRKFTIGLSDNWAIKFHGIVPLQHLKKYNFTKLK